MLRLRDRLAISAAVAAIASVGSLLLPQGARFSGKAVTLHGAGDSAIIVLLFAIVTFIGTFSFLMYQTRRKD